MERDIANFFDKMVDEHIAKNMLQYINMAKLRDDFINYMIETIREHQKFHFVDKLCNHDCDDDLMELTFDVPFWFNVLIDETECKLGKFAQEMYQKYIRNICVNQHNDK